MEGLQGYLSASTSVQWVETTEEAGIEVSGRFLANCGSISDFSTKQQTHIHLYLLKVTEKLMLLSLVCPFYFEHLTLDFSGRKS